MGTAKVRKQNGTYFGQPNYKPPTEPIRSPDYCVRVMQVPDERISYTPEHTAFHEAGHFVVGETLGFVPIISTIDPKSIHEDCPSDAHGNTTFLSNQANWFDTVTQAAGAASEIVFLRKHLDNDKVVAAYPHEGDKNDPDYRKAFRTAKNILRQREQRVREVVAALLEHTTIDRNLQFLSPEEARKLLKHRPGRMDEVSDVLERTSIPGT
jgi:hypothetical protein